MAVTLTTQDSTPCGVVLLCTLQNDGTTLEFDLGCQHFFTPMSKTLSQSLSGGMRFLLMAGLTLVCWLGLTFGAGVWAADLPVELQTLDRQVQELKPLVDRQDWLEIRPYVRGRFRLLRKQLLMLSQELPQSQQKQALQVSRRIADKLVKLDQSAKNFDQPEVEEAYRELRQAVAEFESFYGE